MRRQTPLFIIDSSRQHNLGECDFITCTDQEAGFIAKVDVIEGEKTEVGEGYRIEFPIHGLSSRIAVQRYLQPNTDMKKVGTLLKAAHKEYERRTRTKVDLGNMTIDTCIGGIDTLLRSHRSHMAEIGSDYNARQTAIMIGEILETAETYLNEYKRLKNGKTKN